MNSVKENKKEINYSIRKMIKDDVPQVLNVWKEIGLYEGTNTIYSFMQIDPDGLYVAVNDDDGSIIGCCAGMFVDPNVAFIGLYAVLPIYQGKGIGIHIWNQMIKHIGDKNAGLYAVPDKLTIYRDRAGFQHEDPIRVIVYDSDIIDTSKLNTDCDNILIRKISEDLIDNIIEYDAKIVGYNRGKLLRLTFNEDNTISLVAIDKKENKVVGYGCLRESNANKAMAGPIYVDDQDIGEYLTKELIDNFQLAKENGLYFMSPDASPGKMIAEKLGLEEHEDLPRFFNQYVPKAEFKKMLCIHSPNFSPF